ncbi:MAG: hypothetical protein KGM44_03470 [bacterium]|nr:hypothetical protein [bacterium]
MRVSAIARRVMLLLAAVVVLEGLLIGLLLREAGGLAVVIVVLFFAAGGAWLGPRVSRDAPEAPGVVYTVIGGLELLLGLLMIDPLAVAVLHHHVVGALLVFVLPIVISILTGAAAFAVAVSGGRKG